MNEFNLIQIAMAQEAASTATTSETKVVEKEGLTVQPSVIAFQAFNFLILVVLLHKILYKPLLKIMQEREKKIHDGVANAEKAEGMLKESNLIREDMMKRATVDSQDMVEKARKTGDKLKSEIVTDAQKEAEKIMKNGHTMVEAEKSKTAQELKAMTVNMILAATEKVLRTKMDDAKDAKMVQEIVGGM